MYSEQLEKLIEMALMDGVLTEKEKQILFKKAESLGVDLDEFEMVLNAKLFEKQQSIKKAAETPVVAAAPQSDKFGDVKKCPACGAMVQSLQTKCSDCGHEFSNIEANASIHQLFEMLNEVESQRKAETNPLKAFGSFMVKQIAGGDEVDNRKKDIIKTFPIPNTKEDILEFLSLALPNAKKKGNFMTHQSEANKLHNDFVAVWHAKCEQVFMKAKFSMKDDKKVLEEILQYAKKLGLK